MQRNNRDQAPGQRVNEGNIKHGKKRNVRRIKSAESEHTARARSYYEVSKSQFFLRQFRVPQPNVSQERDAEQNSEGNEDKSDKGLLTVKERERQIHF